MSDWLVSVTDPMNEFVTGVAEAHFVLRQNGVDGPNTFLGTPSNALGKSNAVRKGLVITNDAPLLGNVFVIKLDPTITQKAVIEARNRYVIATRK